MAITKISATITDLTGKRKITSEFLVDTGAAYTVLPKAMVDKLGLKSSRSQKFSLADGTVVQRHLSAAMVKIDGRESPSTVVLGEKDDSPLIGVITLEGMGLMIDPFKRKLRPMRLMLG